MVNFGPLAALILSLVWGTPGNFNGIRVLAALLHGTLVAGVSQTAALNRGRHLYSAGWPSRWALAHISSWSLYMLIPIHFLMLQHLTELSFSVNFDFMLYFFGASCFESVVWCQKGHLASTVHQRFH